MLVLLMLCGVGAVFSAGWMAARTFAPDDAPGVPATPSTAGTDGGTVGDPFAEVLERHPTGVVMCDAGGLVDYRNSAARELVGTHVGVLIGEAVSRHLAAAVGGRASDETLELYGPPRRVVTVASEPLPGGRAVAFIDDVTARRRADQARTDFVANVSHELRTPIGALMVLAETLVDEHDPEVVGRVVTRMQGESERAARTIDDLLHLSELESGAVANRGALRLGDVVDDAVGRVAELASARRITISTLDDDDDHDDGHAGGDGPTSTGVTVTGDRRQLASAVGNLVENAVKYSDPGGVVQVRVRRSGDFGEIRVTDDGIGIPRRDIDRVFERFYRVDRARSRDTGGTGLGLSIVRHVAGNHGGAVTVESVEGAGSTFVLRVPLADAGSDVVAGADVVSGARAPVDEHEGVA